MSLSKLITSLFLLLTIFAFGQSKYQISGSILDSDENALPFANLLLLKQKDSSLVKGEVSNENGRFIFKDVEEGNYLILASMIGYQQDYSANFTVNKDHVIDLHLLDQGETLKEVTLQVEKPLYEQKVDRLVINVESSITAAGGSALEILERSPGVIVNRQNNSISVVGKEGVQIMINGKLSYVPVSSLMQVLDGMRADNIVSIELITTPPANLDAEGNAGFINIVTKKSADLGWNGSYSLSAGYGTHPITSNNINFNYRKNKFNLYGNYSFSIDERDQVFFTSREYVKEDTLNYTQNRAERVGRQRNHNLRLGFDYDISEKTVIGLLVNGYNNKWTMDDAFTQGYDAKNGDIVSYVELTTNERNEWNHFGTNLNLMHKFSADKFISVDLDYLFYNNENPTDYLNTFYDSDFNFVEETFTRSGKLTPLKTLVGKFDYSNKLNDKIKFETGLKGISNGFENDVYVDYLEDGIWVEDPTLTDKSYFDESIFAVYGSLDYNFAKKMSLKVGLRYEYTDSTLDTEKDGNVVDTEYHQLFPSIFLNRKFTDDLSMNLSYSRRISRPTFNELAPFVILLDPNTFISGNPALQPAISNSVKYDLNYKSYIFSLQYTNQDNTIVRFQEYLDEETGRLIFQSENLDFTKTFSVTVGFPIKVTPWWQMQYNLIYVHQDIGAFYDEEPIELTIGYFQGNTTQTFKLPADYSMELTGSYRSPSSFGVALMESLYSVNFGVRKKFGDKWGSLRFSIDDIFNSYIWKTSTDLPEQNLKTDNSFRFRGRTYKLTYSRSFGNKKVKATRERETGAEEERKRVN